VDVSHEELMVRVKIRLENNGTAIDVRIALHYPTTVGEHLVGLVQMCYYLPIDVTC
jgi:hypothetical protein